MDYFDIENIEFKTNLKIFGTEIAADTDLDEDGYGSEQTREEVKLHEGE